MFWVLFDREYNSIVFGISQGSMPSALAAPNGWIWILEGVKLDFHVISLPCETKYAYEHLGFNLVVVWG